MQGLFSTFFKVGRERPKKFMGRRYVKTHERVVRLSFARLKVWLV